MIYGIVRIILKKNPNITNKWKKFWEGVSVLAFGIRTFLIGNLLFDMWPASLYQISMMHFGSDKEFRARASLSLFFAYLTAMVSILEMFVMFYVSHRISILNEERKIEIENEIKKQKTLMREMKSLKNNIVEKSLDDPEGIDEEKEEILVPQKTFRNTLPPLPPLDKSKTPI